MRYYVLLITLYVIHQSLIAQQTFEKIISKPEDQEINNAIEDSFGNYCMVGKIKNANTGFVDGYIIVLDSTGELINEKSIHYSDSDSHIFLNVHYFNNSYILLGKSYFSSRGINKLWYLHLDNNLERISERFYNLPSGKWISYMNSIIDSDTNLVITGYTTRYDTDNNGNHFYNNDAFFYKLNMFGDSLKSKFYTSNIPWHSSFNLIERPNKTGYYAFVSHFINNYGITGQRLILDKNLDSLSIDPIPYEVFDYYSPVYLNQNQILICGKRVAEPPNDYALNVLSITDSCQPVNYNIFKKDDFKEHPAMYNGVSKYGGNIYVGGTSNLDYQNPFWSTKDSWFHLIKINPDLSPVWEYWYGGDAYYFLYSILATSDGGCIMVGNRYDYETQNQERDIYIVKVDEDGVITWQQEIPLDKQSVTVYPNPGTDRLNIKTNQKELYFEMFDINGRQVTGNKKINDNNPVINTSSLKPGIYFYKLSDPENKTVETGKWIKK